MTYKLQFMTLINRDHIKLQYQERSDVFLLSLPLASCSCVEIQNNLGLVETFRGLCYKLLLRAGPARSRCCDIVQLRFECLQRQRFHDSGPCSTLTTHEVKTFSWLSEKNFPCSCMGSLSLVLSHCTSEKSLALPSLHLPNRQLKTPVRFSPFASFS